MWARQLARKRGNRVYFISQLVPKLRAACAGELCLRCICGMPNEPLVSKKPSKKLVGDNRNSCVKGCVDGD
jgi:hypothetical protein